MLKEKGKKKNQFMKKTHWRGRERERVPTTASMYGNAMSDFEGMVFGS